MEPVFTQRIFWLGVALSVLLHLAGAWAFLGLESLEGGVDEHEVSDPPPMPDQKIDLGDPESDALSISWLGFEDYKEHVAPKSEVEQPELTMDPSAPAAPMTPAGIRAATQTATAAREAAAATVEQAVDRVLAGVRSIAAMAGDLAVGEAGESKEEERAEGARTETSEARAEAERESDSQSESEADGEEAPKAETIVATTDGAQGDSDSQSDRGSEGSAGEMDDREADATAVDAKALGDPGRPLTSRGLRIRTVKPAFSHYTTIMANPPDPVIRVHFDSSGTVSLVEVIEPTGNPDIDTPVKNAAYRWRAQGEALKSLQGTDQTLWIDVRILL